MTDDDITEENISRSGLAKITTTQGKSILGVRTETWSTEKQKAFEIAAAIEADLEIFDGRVEHAYTLDIVFNPGRCPECNGYTEQQYANFIYGTQIAPRIMYAPAGYFCEDCPTVIIDEELIAGGVADEFIFQGVLGIDFGKEEEPNLFGTWNGSETIYILNEDHCLEGMTTRGALPEQQPIVRKKHKNDKRKKMAKLSRKRNRKR